MELQRLSLRDTVEWPYEEAYNKLIKAFGLEGRIKDEKDASKTRYSVIEEAAKSSVRTAAGGDIVEPLPWYRFDVALRDFVFKQAVPGLISDQTLARVLLSFYLELTGVDASKFADTLPETAGATKYLRNLLRRKLITRNVSQRVLFFFITECCNKWFDDLVFQNNFDVEEALRDGLRVFAISRSKGKIAKFCLLTGLNPSDARRHKAGTDLVGAMESVLGEMADDFDELECVTKCIQAKLFPLADDHIDIRRFLEQKSNDDDDYHLLDSDEATKEYLVGYFRKETLCRSDEQATTYLDTNFWLMEKATQAYRKWALAPGAFDDVDLVDTASPPYVEPNSLILAPLGAPINDQTANPLEAATHSLVRRYQRSLPLESDKDNTLYDMIRRFEAGNFNNPDQLARIHAQLTYRLEVCELAMQIVNRLELWKGAAVPISAWDPRTREGADMRVRKIMVGQLQQNTSWFKPKKAGDGSYYRKPLFYVARAMDMHGYHGEQVLEQIEKAKKLLQETTEIGLR